MSVVNFLKTVILRLSGRQPKTPPLQAAQQVDASLVRLFRILEKTRDDEIPCDEVFELLDQYAELVARHEDAAGLLPLVKDHLDRCSNCREEYEALARIIEATSETGS